ncbi:hypothetical protein [Aquisalimonas sp.]|uniref:CAF17-like 4Fe-4S cluster assembly/insertion protein YgfZ n=1 Tax=Aquisalimonas sp. TaxID=1872621 RepID=UPI0025C5F199|nr:hypothetical protein [Aquisalimonas sp.]
MSNRPETAPTIDWYTLLSLQQARFDGQGRLLDFGDAAGELHAVLGAGGVMPLPGVGVIRVVGQDAPAFLHAQLSHSVDDQGTEQWRLAGYCNPKGRLLGLFQVVRLEADDFLLLTDASLIEPLVKRLRMFVLRARVALQDFTAHAGVWGATGSGAAALTELTGTLPQGVGAAMHAGDTTVLNLNADTERFLVIAHARDAAGLWRGLTAGSRPITPAAWTLLEVRAGVPSITAGTSERFVPQQVNLDLIDGIDFRKGCYPGQEVVARMHYRGKASRRMFGLATPGGQAPAPGDSVLTADGETAGEIVQGVAGPTGVEALAVLRVEFRDRQDLRIAGQAARFMPLPYPVPPVAEDEAAGK